MKQVTLTKIHKEIHRLDKSIKKEDDAFKIATILLVGLRTKNVREISKFSKLPQPFVSKIKQKLVAGNVWVGHKTAVNFFDKDDGGISFWLAVLVGQGFMKMVRS